MSIDFFAWRNPLSVKSALSQHTPLEQFLLAAPVHTFSPPWCFSHFAIISEEPVCRPSFIRLWGLWLQGLCLVFGLSSVHYIAEKGRSPPKIYVRWKEGEGQYLMDNPLTEQRCFGPPSSQAQPQETSWKASPHLDYTLGRHPLSSHLILTSSSPQMCRTIDAHSVPSPSSQIQGILDHYKCMAQTWDFASREVGTRVGWSKRSNQGAETTTNRLRSACTTGGLADEAWIHANRKIFSEGNKRILNRKENQMGIVRQACNPSWGRIITMSSRPVWDTGSWRPAWTT